VAVVTRSVSVTPAKARPVATGPEADAVYLNGDIYTIDERFRRVPAMAVKDGRFLAVGSNAMVKGSIGRNTEVVDLKGKTVFPGLWDAHLHFSWYGESLVHVDLNGLQKHECLAAIKAAVDEAEPGEWIQGTGWNQVLWTDQDGLVGGLPTAAMLDGVSPDNPVLLERTDGHATWCNTRLLTLSGVTKDTPEVDEGLIVRHPDGAPTGCFLDAAMRVLTSAPPMTEHETRGAYQAAERALFAYGHTSVCDMGGGRAVIERMKDMYADAQLKIRVQQYVDVEDAPAYYGQPLAARLRLFDDRYTVNGIKILNDGAMGSAGAWFMEPYSDNAIFGRPPGWVGFPTFGGPYHDADGDPVLVPTIQQNTDKLVEALKPAVKAGFQVAVHCIGDAANRGYLDAVQKVEQDLPQRTTDPRFRDEHAQCPHIADLKRFKPLKVIPSMQAQHATQEVTMFESRVGRERTVNGGYVWRSLIDLGNVIAGGSDASVEVPNPWWGLFSAVTRINKDGYDDGKAWYPSQCMTREEALRSFTSWAAYAAFEEADRGSVEQGKLADFVVVGYPNTGDTDYMTMPAGDIWRMKADMTVVGGETVFTAPGFCLTE
jgi:hypothetical protein